MIVKSTTSFACKKLGAALTVAISLAGCTSSMAGDDSGRLMGSGITEARNGLSKTQSGVDEFNGSQSAGLADINSGMGMMNQGVADMHSGMNMMSSGMMMNCMDGGSLGMMNALQQAMDEMHQGQSLLTIDAGSNVTEGMAHMNNGMPMMKSTLDQAQNSMGCMGHGNMMSGGTY